MAKGYRWVDRDQPFLLPPDMRGWPPADHPVWLVIGAVGQHLDTPAFHAWRRTGGAGTAGYDPGMLVLLVMWAYANGVSSSRRIGALCRTDVAFRVICAGDVPDHVTIARFRAGSAVAVRSLFTEVLVLCARLGMGRLGTVTVDGTKVAAGASKAANRTGEGCGSGPRRLRSPMRREQRDAGAVAAGWRGCRGKRPVPPERAVSVRNARTALDKAIARAGQAEQAAAEGGKQEGPWPGPQYHPTGPRRGPDHLTPGPGTRPPQPRRPDSQARAPRAHRMPPPPKQLRHSPSYRGDGAITRAATGVMAPSPGL